MGCIERYFKLRRGDIVFVKYTFEALDNLLVVTTVNRDRDIIVLRIAPGCEDEVERVLESFEGTVCLEEIEAPDFHESR
ncbi:DUF4911 domain-containing protein [Desulfoluna spongiiphila]|uniref:Uncharacterized protein n=1 Tax=Desulfoluna spongiiphila TaxID=419481 RepID=A0A1G5HB77_9BACT|nr:DUF4911 domain-containing protein [Desulfoluna spongiiphila]SCY61016.1 protein of unknown function [Desulfoluna spongiiphila]VVS94598.1 protein of unknown function duf4911 [Desulfoluna spongiiphila]